jgi:cathepsin D
VTIQGKSISVSSSEGLAAIDTGTTLIGAPSDITTEIWSNVPGSVALTGQYQGMYSFPCTTSVAVTLSFGGTTWTITTDDMNLGAVSGSGKNQMCAGGIFDVGSTVGNAQGAPSWIVGDTFLKNVYTVFQANPPAVGFAQLASGLSSSSGTSGSNSISLTGTAGVPLPSGSSGLGSASPSMILSTSLSLVCLLAVLLVNL